MNNWEFHGYFKKTFLQKSTLSKNIIFKNSTQIILSKKFLKNPSKTHCKSIKS